MPEHTEITTEDALVDALNYTQALTGMGGGAITLIILGFIGKALYSKFREGLVTAKEFEELEKYIRRIDKKEQKTRNSVMKIAGHIDIDLPELAD